MSNVLAQSIPVLPPLAPASLEADDLILEDVEEVEDVEVEDVEDVEEDMEGDGVADETVSEDLNDNSNVESDIQLEPSNSQDSANPGIEDSDVNGAAVDSETTGLDNTELNEALEDPLLEDNLDELFDVDVDESFDPDLNEPLVDDLEENNVVPAPIQVETFKPNQGAQIFEDVVLTPSAMINPTTLRGISGGPLTASRVAGRTDTVTGICTGFVDRNPDHRIELTEFFDYLSLQVESPEDTVLVVRGPGGSWCNDDVVGFNPGLTGEWFSGVYDIWVGSYNEQTYHPYVIRLSDSQ